MIGSNVVELAGLLESNAAELAELIASFPPDSRLTRYGDEFCVAEHACHLRDLERDGFTPEFAACSTRTIRCCPATTAPRRRGVRLPDARTHCAR